MGKKKTKPTKKGRKRVAKEDVKYSTSLPPAVEGQLRCFLRVSITKIDWMLAKPPDVTHIRLRWWGEVTDGTVFRPLDMRNPQKSTSRTIARFPVRCGPKQFTAYLNDMGTLLLEVLKGSAMTPVGKVQINEIGHLTPQIPINGFFPVFSNKDPEKIADLHVSMAFEPLPTSYDSSSSMPTTDVSVATGSVATDTSLRRHRPHSSSSAHKPEPHPSRHMPSSDDGAFLSPVKQPPSDGERRIQAPTGIDSDYSFVVGPGADRTKSSRVAADVLDMPENAQEPGVPDDSVLGPTSKYQDAYRVQNPRPHLRDTAPDRISINQLVATGQHHPINPGSKTGQDLITALLDRGTKLRNAMVVSEVQPQEKRMTGIGTDSEVRVSLPERGPRMLRRSSSGELFREILDADDKEQRLAAMQEGDKEESFNTEFKAVELLVGDKLSKKELNSLKALQGGTSPTSSVSSHSDGDISEPEDPVHDTSILEELFYKGLRSSSDDNLSDLLSSDSDDEKERRKSKKGRRRITTPDINDPGNRRPPSRRSSSSRQGSFSTTPPTSDRPAGEHERRPGDTDRSSSVMPSDRVRDRGEELSSDSEAGSISRMSDGSHVSFDGPQEEEVKVSPSDGLSVERLTLLGKVHIARVMVDTLTLESIDDLPTASPHVRSNRASRMRGKPPRPVTRTKKKSYFVEYQFPVVASSRDKSLVNTMATEVMRLVSKKVTDSGANFGHRSVFPVSFNGSAVDRWWKQMVVFKVFSRTPGQKTPTFLGVSSLRLREVLQSPDLAIQQELEVRDKSSNHRQSPSSRSSEEDGIPRNAVPVIGKLKVTIELGSDNRDFSMGLARTKLAEMRGAKIVPLPANQQKLPLKITTSTSSTVSSERQKQITSQGIQTEQDQPEIIHSDVPAGGRKDRTSRRSSDRSKSPVEEDMNRGRPSEKQDVFSDEDGARGHSSSHQVQYIDRTEPAVHPQPAEHEGLTLHSLLLIPEGRGITMQGVVPVIRSDKNPQLQPQPAAQVMTGWSGWSHDRDRTTRNTYLVCRMFWSDDSVRSDVCWGTSEPNYNFIQVAPVLLTASLLERTRNNVMVIEVWDKKTSAQNDQLVGIAKVSLHQFYMSFRDRRIASTLLKSQYPVVAVDNYINITDPFSGVQYGQIKVLLALGSMEQVSALQRLKCDKDMIADVRPERPVHYLERGDSSTKRDTTDSIDNMIEHVFEVVVEGVRGMTQLDDTYWGEADCFVQYHFPSQPHEQGTTSGKPTQAGAPVLRPHRTATTLCVPDPTFHDVTRHRIILPQGIPAQRELLTACAGVGGGAGGIPFEVWCRYYYPNIRDQVAAKALLPLAKLCAMVTMQRRGEPSVQTFSLPLKMQHVEDDDLTPEQRAKMQDAGLLDVTISYKNAVIRESARDSSAAKPGGPHVCLSVGVLRACGLKMAATHLAQFDAGMQYASEVGVNAYVKMELSFLADEDMRISRTIARTFAPEFSHHVDFPCPLLLTDGDNEAVSLAEALESAEMRLQVWHQTPGFRPEHGTDYRQLDPGSGAPLSGRQLVPGSVDILLGTAVVPLYSLLTHRTGIQGWIPLTIPSQGWAATHTDPTSPSDTPKDATTHRGLERIGGGLEMSIKFAHPNDRERVVDAARSVGWSPHGIVDDVEIWEEDQDLNRSLTSDVTVHTDATWFPDYTALRPGQDAMDAQAKAYIRYKFYDKAAICSKLCYLDISEDGFITADFKHAHNFQAAHTQPFAWYLREERLEIQLWISYNQDHPGQNQPRPRHRDKLIGCAYVDLSPLTDKRSKHHRVSGLYPLFKPGASNMGGACIRVHVNMKTSHRKQSRQEDLDTTDDISTSPHRERTHHGRLHQRHGDLDKERQVEEWLEDEQAQELERQRKAREEEERRRAEEEACRNRPVLMKVLIERAMHLPSVQDTKGMQNCQPSCYVTFQSAEEPSVVQTPTIPNSAQPSWGFEANIKISKEVLENQCFILKVWHQTGSSPDMGSDRVLGFCSIDMGPLLAGFRSLNGWYNIMDFSGQCHGQIKVSITPDESLSPLKKSPKQRTLTMSPNTSAVFIPGLSYVIPHPVPPNSLHMNVGVRSSGVPLTATGQSHFQEHLKNIRKFHQDLQDRLKSHHPELGTRQRGDVAKEKDKEEVNILSVSEPATSSVTTSFLVQNLRKNLQELDIVHQKLQQRLSTSDINTKASREPSQRESRTFHQSSGKDPQLEVDDRGDLSSESNSSASERTRTKNTYHQRGSIEDLNFQDGVTSLRTQNPDIHEPPLRRSPSELSEDWEDSVQFNNVHKQQGENKDLLHQHQDEELDDDASDVIIPKALNDVSSANFGNGLGIDFQHTIPDSQLRNYQNPLFVRLSEENNLTYDIERPNQNVSGRDDNALAGGGKLSRQNNDQSVHHINRNTQVQNRNSSESEESADSVHEHLPASQEQLYSRPLHSDMHPHDKSQLGESDRDMTRILADATNRQHLDDDKDQDSLANKLTAENILSQTNQLNREFQQLPGNRDIIQEGDEEESLLSERLDLRAEFPSRHSSDSSGTSSTTNNFSKQTQDPTFYDGSLPTSVPVRNAQPQTNNQSYRKDNEDILQRQRSLSWSSDDSVVLTLDPEVARKQQKHMEERDTAYAAETASVPSSAPMPNFFLPPQDLEASMRALHNAVTFLPRSQPREDILPDAESSNRSYQKSQVAAELVSRLGGPSAVPMATHQPAARGAFGLAKKPKYKAPSAEEAKRIAKIFGSKYSVPF